MPQEGYADPIMNNGPRFHSDVPVIKLTERVTRAIEASDVSSTPPVVETPDGVTHETRPTPWPCPTLGLVLHLARPLGHTRRLGWRSVLPDTSAAPDTWVGAPSRPTLDRARHLGWCLTLGLVLHLA